jgi:hypothetical protein
MDGKGNPVLVDHEDVIKAHQAGIDAGDPKFNRKVSRPAILCNDHATLGHKLNQNFIAVIREEQARKDAILQSVADAAGVDLAPDPEKIKAEVNAENLSPREKTVKIFTTVQALQEIAKDFRAQYQYQFDSQRVLTVSHPQLTAEHKAIVQKTADMKHGQGKVKIK